LCRSMMMLSSGRSWRSDGLIFEVLGACFTIDVQQADRSTRAASRSSCYYSSYNYCSTLYWLVFVVEYIKPTVAILYLVLETMFQRTKSTSRWRHRTFLIWHGILLAQVKKTHIFCESS
jgi:hypothetical protein